MVDESADHGVRFQGDARIAPAGVEQNVVQIHPVHDDVRIFEAVAQGRPGGDPRDFLAVERVEHQQGRWGIRRREHLVAQADAVEHVKHVWPELDAIADGAEGWRPFQHAHLLAIAR